MILEGFTEIMAERTVIEAKTHYRLNKVLFILYTIVFLNVYIFAKKKWLIAYYIWWVHGTFWLDEYPWSNEKGHGNWIMGGRMEIISRKQMQVIV